MSEMKKWAVMVGKSRVMKVYASTHEEAVQRAEGQLKRIGRYGIWKEWNDGGRVVNELVQK